MLQERAREAPDATALDDGERRRSWAELWDRVNRTARLLREDLGLAPGDHAAALLHNRVECFELMHAAIRAGIWLTPINWHLAPPEVSYILKDCGAKVFIGHERVADLCSKSATDAGLEPEQCFSIGKIEGFRPFAELGEGQSEEAPADRCAGAVMNYTSGTTGNPKGVAYTQRSTYLHTVTNTGTLEMNQADNLLPIVPMFHAAAWGLPFIAVSVGAKLTYPGHDLSAETLGPA